MCRLCPYSFLHDYGHDQGMIMFVSCLGKCKCTWSCHVRMHILYTCPSPCLCDVYEYVEVNVVNMELGNKECWNADAEKLVWHRYIYRQSSTITWQWLSSTVICPVTLVTDVCFSAQLCFFITRMHYSCSATAIKVHKFHS
jgi:hypothetical protein